MWRRAASHVNKELVTNRAVGAEGVVEVLEKLEPTIGLEPMTCRLRSQGRARHAPKPTDNCLIHRSWPQSPSRGYWAWPHPFPHNSRTAQTTQPLYDPA